MDRVFNIPTKIFNNRRNKKGKLAIAAWLGIKFTYGNSTKYDISKDAIKAFYHCGEKYANDIIKAMWDESELFFMNKRKNCVFAKSQKNKEVKLSKETRNKQNYEYQGDDVTTVKVPKQLLADKNNKVTLSIKELLELIDNILICKEYDNHLGYKLSDGDRQGCDEICETSDRKSMSYVAKKVGLNRTTLHRRVKALIESGYGVKKGGNIEKCHPKDKNAIRGLNKRTRMPYWFVCVPTYLELSNDCPFVFRHIIWNHRQRLLAKMSKCEKSIKKTIYAKNPNLSSEEIEFQIMVQKQIQMREMYD